MKPSFRPDDVILCHLVRVIAQQIIYSGVFVEGILEQIFIVSSRKTPIRLLLSNLIIE
jgi:hypothetical protein